jgi:F-box/leucine-rich repeat protein 2/20
MMPRPRLSVIADPWEPDFGLPRNAKSRRRRVLERITRFGSSPTLIKGEPSHDPVDSRTEKHTASCVSLSSGSLGDGNETPWRAPTSASKRLFGLNSGTRSSLEVFMDCVDEPETAEQRDGPGWTNLPDEVKIQILGQLDPMERVRCSSVSFPFASSRTSAWLTGRLLVQVSKEFHQLCFDGQLWQVLDASEFYNRISVDQLSQLIVATGSFVKHLNLRCGNSKLPECAGSRRHF